MYLNVGVYFECRYILNVSNKMSSNDVCSQMAYEANNKQEHPATVDAGSVRKFP